VPEGAEPIVGRRDAWLAFGRRSGSEYEMSVRLYVGNLAYSTMDHQLREAFAQHGEVTSAEVIIDRASGQSRGFGFVELGSPDDARRAIEAMNGATLDGRSIVVNAARERSGGGGGGGGRSAGRGGPGAGRSGGGGRGGGGGGRGGGRDRRDRDRNDW
jgi:RNA recognition motif-containing protein